MYSAKPTKTKCDIVVDEILAMIMRGEYKENDKLPNEQYFMEYFGMSRVTIRESFKKLSVLGVVEVCQGKGTFVKKVDVNTLLQPLYSAFVVSGLNLAQIFDARVYIEYGTAKLAARNAGRDEIEKLADLVKELDKTVLNRDVAEFSRLDVAFHEMVADMSGNVIMAVMYRTIKEILSQYIAKVNLMPAVVENSQKQHHQILDSISRREDTRAGEIMRDHVRSVQSRLQKQIDEGLAPRYVK